MGPFDQRKASSAEDEDVDVEEMRRQIIELKRSSGMKWPDYQEKFGLLDSERSIFSQISTYKNPPGIIRLYGRLIKNKKSRDIDVSHDRFGGYSRSALSWLGGDYALIRPSTSEDNIIYGYMSEVSWSSDHKCYRIRIDDKEGTLTEGNVVYLKDTNCISILFSHELNHSMLLMQRHFDDENLSGIFSSILPRHNTYEPISIPVVLVKKEHTIPLGTGVIDVNHTLYQRSLHLIKSSRSIWCTNGWWVNPGL